MTLISSKSSKQSLLPCTNSLSVIIAESWLERLPIAYLGCTISLPITNTNNGKRVSIFDEGERTFQFSEHLVVALTHFVVRIFQPNDLGLSVEVLLHAQLPQRL